MFRALSAHRVDSLRRFASRRGFTTRRRFEPRQLLKTLRDFELVSWFEYRVGIQFMVRKNLGAGFGERDVTDEVFIMFYLHYIEGETTGRTGIT